MRLVQGTGRGQKDLEEILLMDLKSFRWVDFHLNIVLLALTMSSIVRMRMTASSTQTHFQ